ncbi:hypothetical protein ES332_A09G053300v1 [Gossypium tomentosum]|uniref:WRKY domain-containing protein n=1 Tax=Gossypium tomentosum TaxID=34277 RepID=A0A5D2P3S9_GOSTO|nr:hypothetical protein ES332_A09G053300v1 [Gossypium tomentosum]
MENCQMFFPISSSPSEANMAPNSCQAFNSFHGHSSNGLLLDWKSSSSRSAENCFIQKPEIEKTDNQMMKSSSVGKQKENKKRKQRYAFETRSQVDVLDDGYRWRKYGQKAVKDNKFPRSYYRCTHQGCNVKKQVQRLTKDESVVVTTYEGMHTHPSHKPTDNFEHILNQMHIYKPF